MCDDYDAYKKNTNIISQVNDCEREREKDK